MPSESCDTRSVNRGAPASPEGRDSVNNAHDVEVDTRTAMVERLAQAINDWHESGRSYGVLWVPPGAALLLASHLFDCGVRLPDAAGALVGDEHGILHLTGAYILGCVCNGAPLHAHFLGTTVWINLPPGAECQEEPGRATIQGRDES